MVSVKAVLRGKFIALSIDAKTKAKKKVRKISKKNPDDEPHDTVKTKTKKSQNH